MSKLRNTSLPILLALGLAASSFACKTERDCGRSSESLIQCVRDAVAKQSRYFAEIHYQLLHPPHGAASGEVPTTLIEGRAKLLYAKPGKLRLAAGVRETPLYVGGATASEQLITSDGQRMLGQVQTRDPDGKPVDDFVQVDRALVAKGRPEFDSGITLNGTGFIPGRELLESTKYILDKYQFDAAVPTEVEVSGEPCWEITGKRSAKSMLDELVAEAHSMVYELVLVLANVDRTDTKAQERFEVDLDMRAASLAAFQTVTLAVSKKDLLPRRWVMGRKPGDRRHVMTVEKMDLAPDVQPSLFSTETSSATPDITNPVERARAHQEKTMKDFAELVDVVVGQLLARIEKQTQQ